MEEKTQTYIRVQDVQKRYGWRKILKGASFEAQSGQCVALLGMNGSGKSTLLSILAGVQNCERGTAVVNGINLLTDKKTAGKIVGYVPQGNPLIQDLTVRDNLKLWYCRQPAGYGERTPGRAVKDAWNRPDASYVGKETVRRHEKKSIHRDFHVGKSEGIVDG